MAALLSLLAGAPGCAVHRVQDEPSPVVAPPASFPASAESPGRAAAEPTSVAAWWSEFDDAALSGLIEESLAANLTVADFAGRLAAARAVARQAGAELRPAADASGSLGLASEDEDGVDGAVDGLEFSGGVAVAVSWEIDLFGRLASRERGAVLDALASADDLDAVRLAVAADAAAAYYAAVEQRLLLELLQRQIERDRTLLDLIELRFAQGGANSLDVLQQRAQLAEARALVPGARARCCRTSRLFAPPWAKRSSIRSSNVRSRSIWR
ncbi:MAG: TolC family protein, partial [Planctomycetota bacterium]